MQVYLEICALRQHISDLCLLNILLQLSLYFLPLCAPEVVPVNTLGFRCEWIFRCGFVPSAHDYEMANNIEHQTHVSHSDCILCAWGPTLCHNERLFFALILLRVLNTSARIINNIYSIDGLIVKLWNENWEYAGFVT